MVNLRTARAENREEIPLHYECVTLRPHLAAVSWIMTIALAVGGITAMIKGAGSLIELFGAAAAAIGGISLTAVIRCRRHELTLGRKWLRTAMGPIKRDLPMALVTGATQRTAIGWRRFFADDVVVIELNVGASGPCYPSRDPDATIEAIREVVGETAGRNREEVGA